LYVRNYAADKTIGDRVIVDFERDPEIDRFLMLDESGGMIAIGYERVHMTWPALIQLADVIKHAQKTLKPKKD
jgi:hypothetical protein